MDTVFSSQFWALPAAFILTVVLIPPIKVIAQKLKFVSKIDFRRRELVPRPLLGGLAVFTGVLIAHAIFASIPLSLVLPGLGLVALGAIDDRYQINAKAKMLCILGAAGLWLAMTPAESLLLVKLGLPTPVAYLLHAFWVVGLINAVNMIDGMDGLASGMATLGLVFLGFFLPAELRVFAWSLAAGCIGHLVYNRPPASIFLGDSGSLLLGFVMAALGSIVETKSVGATSVLVPLFILAHPEVDAVLAIARRWRAGTPLFHGDKDHIHHKLRRIGLSGHESLGIAYFTTAYCGVTALLIDSLGSGWPLALLSFLSVGGMSAILGGVYFTEYRLAAQFSQLGTPILHRHIGATEDPVWPTVSYQAVVFDLLPYYKEMQERGIAELNAFISEFSSWVNTSFRDHQIVPAGSYSVIVIAEMSANGGVKQEQVLRSFKGIVSNHDLLKNDVGIPWGLQFYMSPTDAQALQRKFGPYLRSAVVDSSKAAA